MWFNTLFPFLFIGIFVFVIGSFAIKFFRYGGFKAALFGARIERTLGEVSGGGMVFGSMTVKVHALDGDTPEKAVGLELIAKTFASYHVMPVTLSASETMHLASLLQTAAMGKQG